MTRSLRRDHQAVSNVIGAIVVTGLVFSLLLTIRLSFVPVWEKNAEGAQMVGVERQLATIKSELDRQVDNRTLASITNAVTLGRETSSIFSAGAASARKIQFDVSSHTMNFQANRLLVLQNNGTNTVGLSPTWIPIPSSSTITSVTRIESLRIRISPLNQNLVGENVNLTVRDANNALLGYFLVTGYMSQNDFIVSSAVYQGATTKLAENANAQDKQTSYTNYYIDALDPSLLFPQVIASGAAPLTLGLSHTPGVNADYTISYAQSVAGGGEVLVGSAGVLLQPYNANYGSGSLVFTAVSSYRVPQTYVLENGALILSQPDGAAFKIPPSFSVSRAGSVTNVAFSMPSLSGDAASLTGTSSAKVTTSAFLTTSIKANAPRFQATVTTAYPTLWYNYWDATLKAAGLSSTTTPYPQYTVSKTATTASVAIFGTTADPTSITYDLAVNLKQASINVKLSG